MFYNETHFVIKFKNDHLKSDNLSVKLSLKSFILPTIILCILTLYSVFSLLYPEKIVFSFKKTAREPVQVAASKKNRQIASLNEQQSIVVKCGQLDKKIQVTSSQVLMRFQDCENEKKITEFKLVNTTNSYMAQIFHSSDNNIATEFIQLSKGENILNLEISLNDKQKKTQIIKIERISTEIQ